MTVAKVGQPAAPSEHEEMSVQETKKAFGTEITSKTEKLPDVGLLAKASPLDTKNKEVYDRNFKVFKNLYKSNVENYRLLNS